MSGTHAYAVLEVSESVYEEIFYKLKDAGYGHAFHEDEGRFLIDMHGIAITKQSATPALESRNA